MNAIIAQKIRLLCQSKHITVYQLLKDCGIRKSLLYDLEKRDITPSITVMVSIADYLGCTVDFLIGREEK